MPDKKCPHCGLWNTASALRCDCGYDFEKGTVEKSDDKLEMRQSPPNLLRTSIYGIGAGISLALSIVPSLSSYSGDLVSFSIFFVLFLLITILFFFKEIRRRTDLESPETKPQSPEKILLFILLALSGVGILSIWLTITLFRPDAGQGAIFLLVCIPIDCGYVALALGILSWLFYRRGSETKPSG